MKTQVRPSHHTDRHVCNMHSCCQTPYCLHCSDATHTTWHIINRHIINSSTGAAASLPCFLAQRSNSRAVLSAAYITHLRMFTSSTTACAASLPLKMAPSMLARYFCLV